MIFLTIGTWRVGYNRLVEAVDELLSSGVITEEVIAQTGYSSYKPKHMTVIEFCSPGEFRNLISKAGLVISHAGMGTIIETVQLLKPLITVPRRRSLGEVDNDHQFTTAKQLEAEGKILVAYEVSELPAKLQQAKSFVPVQSNNDDKIVKTIQEFIERLAERKKTTLQDKSGPISKIWPYKILSCDDNDIKNNLTNIMEHFQKKGWHFDSVVFVPKAGIYLGRMFCELFDNSYEVNYITARRSSTESKNNWLKRLIFKKKWLANPARHLEVLIRLLKLCLGCRQKMIFQPNADFNVTNKSLLVIDDSVDTGTTLRMVSSALLDKGAKSVTTACISNHLLPDRVNVDYSVYRYKLLRTKNSRDYYAA